MTSLLARQGSRRASVPASTRRAGWSSGRCQDAAYLAPVVRARVAPTRLDMLSAIDISSARHASRSTASCRIMHRCERAGCNDDVRVPARPDDTTGVQRSTTKRHPRTLEIETEQFRGAQREP